MSQVKNDADKLRDVLYWRKKESTFARDINHKEEVPKQPGHIIPQKENLEWAPLYNFKARRKDDGSWDYFGAYRSDSINTTADYILKIKRKLGKKKLKQYQLFMVEPVKKVSLAARDPSFILDHIDFENTTGRQRLQIYKELILHQYDSGVGIKKLMDIYRLEHKDIKEFLEAHGREIRKGKPRKQV